MECEPSDSVHRTSKTREDPADLRVSLGALSLDGSAKHSLPASPGKSEPVKSAPKKPHSDDNDDSSLQFDDAKAAGNSDELVIHNSCPCCGNDAKLICTQCRSQKYCSVACQKAHWIDGGHKKQCQSVEGRTVLVDVTEEGSPEALPPDAISLNVFILKVQVALNSSVSPMIAYDYSRSVYYLISAENCKKSKLLDRTIRRTGDVMGSKAYFDAKFRARDKKLIIFLDQRHINLTW